MRVVHTLDYYAVGYGRPQAVNLLAEAQRSIGYETTVLVGDCFGAEDLIAFNHFRSDELDRKSIARTRHNGWRDWLFRACDEIRPDLIHTHEIADAWALAGKTDVPVILSIGVDYRTSPQAQFALEVAGQVDWVEYWNPDTAGWLLQGGVNNISWNCDLVKAPPLEYRKPEKGLIAMQGRIDENKNQALLVELMPEIVAAVPEARLMLIGDGPMRDPLQNRALSLGLGEQIIFPGWQSDPLPLLAQASIAVYPSRSMGFDRTVMEAMTLGIPVITSPEISPVIHYGKYGTVAADKYVAEQIIRILSKNDLQDEVGRAQEHAIAHYGPKAVLSRTEKVYKGLLQD